MKRPAFTMIELVLVIVVLGILAALAMPRLDRDLRQEAADSILSNIRYTQHLALMDDKQKFDKAKWQQRFWHLYFGTCESKAFYTIGSDDNMDSSSNARVDHTEAAIDPANGKLIWATDGSSCSGTQSPTDISPNIFIGKKYGVTTITPGGGCSNKYIGFDHLGRPYASAFPSSSKPNNAGRISSMCTFTFALSDGGTFAISIQPETGYAQIVDQNAS